MYSRVFTGILIAAGVVFGQGSGQTAAPGEQGAGSARIRSRPGRTSLSGLINSVSTKHSAPGDRIYLETVFPIVINSHIVIPPGSYVMGTVTEIKKARTSSRASGTVRSLRQPDAAERRHPRFPVTAGPDRCARRREPGPQGREYRRAIPIKEATCARLRRPRPAARPSARLRVQPPGMSGWAPVSAALRALLRGWPECCFRKRARCRSGQRQHD